MTNYFPENERRDFAIFDDYIFLNSASMTPLAKPVREAIEWFAKSQSAGAYLDMEKWILTTNACRKKMARITGSKKSEISFIRNTSDGVSLVAEGLAFSGGDEVIIGDIEFPSNVYPWMNLARKGVKVKVVKNIDGRLTPAIYEEAITSRTKLIALSSVQYASGYRADLSAMADLCHHHGAFLFVDAIQSLGAIPMDVKESGIDFMSCGGHKWLCALEGIGIFYCAEEHRDKLAVTRAGWHTVDNALDFGDINFTIRSGGERFEEGTANQIGIYALNAALDMLLSAGIDNIYEHILSLGDKLRSGLTSLGFDLITPHDNRNELSGITIFSHKDPNRTKDISKILLDNHILIIERNDTIRVSPHFFNTEDDIDRLIDVLSVAG